MPAVRARRPGLRVATTRREYWRLANVADATLQEASNWSWGTKGRDGFPFTAPVGKFKPNGFGLYDMHGNACEWCSDWYGADYYSQSPEEDPQGPATGESRVVRGGGWCLNPVLCRSASRGNLEPTFRDFSNGFRVVCEVK